MNEQNAAHVDELPNLPLPRSFDAAWRCATFTADQMQAYARSALEAARVAPVGDAAWGFRYRHKPTGNEMAARMPVDSFFRDNPSCELLGYLFASPVVASGQVRGLVAKLEKVISGLQFNRGTHVEWRDWLGKSPDNEKVNPHAGNAKFHADTVLEYDQHIASIRGAICALADTAPTAAGEDCKTCHGIGEVGHLTRDNGYDNYPCPDCGATGSAEHAPRCATEQPARELATFDREYLRRPVATPTQGGEYTAVFHPDYGRENAKALKGATQPGPWDWFVECLRVLEDVSTEMRATGRGDTRFRRLIETMPRNEVSASAARSGDAVSLIAAERARQISVEGWSLDHDDRHTRGQLADAAACYAATTRAFAAEERAGRAYETYTAYSDLWPWACEWWKPTPDRVRQLVKAGALIAAEIERLQRAALQPAARQGGDV